MLPLYTSGKVLQVTAFFFVTFCHPFRIVLSIYLQQGIHVLVWCWSSFVYWVKLCKQLGVFFSHFFLIVLSNYL